MAIEERNVWYKILSKLENPSCYSFLMEHLHKDIENSDGTGCF